MSFLKSLNFNLLLLNTTHHCLLNRCGHKESFQYPIAYSRQFLQNLIWDNVSSHKIHGQMSMEYLRKILQNCYQILSYWLTLAIHIMQLLNKAQTFHWRIQNGDLGSLSPNPLQTFGFSMPLVWTKVLSKTESKIFLNLKYLKSTHLEIFSLFGSRVKKESK